MFELLSLPCLWAQAGGPPQPSRLLTTLSWMFTWGEPAVTVLGFWGGPLTWVKVVGLFCLLGWTVSWLVAAIKNRAAGRGDALDIAGLVALIAAPVCVLLHVLETTGRMSAGGVPFVLILAIASAGVLVLWVERALWAAILRLGRGADRFVLLGIHLALALGMGVSFMIRQATGGSQTDQEALIQGGRMGATYMGFVVLASVAVLVLRELAALRWRRIYSIAWQSVIEATRRMWAPWVVISVFLVILAFTDWFLTPPRPAELGRLYVGTLALLCSLLLMVMVTILAPISLPQDIQNQTIYTVVSKPVRRLELVWGRMLGFMAIVTALLLVFGGISLGYLWRTVHGTIVAREQEAVQAERDGHRDHARVLRDQVDQLRTRMSARVPVKGSLTFIDSHGIPRIKGIDVGQELEYRSHVEGATQAMAIWTYGILPDPIDQKLHEKDLRHPVPLIDKRIPVEKFLVDGTVEGLLNKITELKYREAIADRAQQAGNLSAADSSRLAADAARAREEARRITGELEQLRAQADRLDAQARAADTAGRAADAQKLREQAAALHSPPVQLEATFTVYRTTKGVLGEPVMASLKAINPRTEQEVRAVFPIREYYTNKLGIDSSILAGSQGDLRIEVQCISPTQYLGVAESDLFLLAQSDQFGPNFMKGLFGIWLQAMVLTAIGVWAGTFLSWPVALLTTIAFFVAGQVAFGFLQEFAMSTLQGGGPFESLIRLLSHDNLQNELAPTLAVVTAKTLDAVVMPIMSRLVFVVPNFTALDVSNTVADGFAVTGQQVLGNGLLALAYAIPFSLAGFFILKHREVAA